MLNWDKPSDKKSGQRSRKAGCGSAHKCDTSKNVDEQCDEYPFSSTSTADDVSASYSRCVPRLQNNRKSGESMCGFH